MTGLMRFTRKLDRRMIDFITSFLLSNIASIIAIGMIVWVLFDRLGSLHFSMITLCSLLLVSVLTHKYSYLLDSHSRTHAVILANILMIGLLTLTVITDCIGLYVITYFAMQCYFSLYYTARSAVAQVLILSDELVLTDNEAPQRPFESHASKDKLSFKQLNSVIEVTDKIGAILSASTITLLFTVLGESYMLVLSGFIYLLSTVLIAKFGEPTVKHLAINNNVALSNLGKTPKNETTSETETEAKTPINTHPQTPKPSIPVATTKKGFDWYFAQPIAWLITLAIFVNLVVILSNTINSIYLYDVLKITPETFAYLGIAFNTGSMAGALLVNLMTSAKRVIYGCFTVTLLMSWFIALNPVFEMFLIASSTFGFVNSANRVMFASVIMHSIASHEVASFYGLRKSLLQGLQFLVLFGINLTLFTIPKVDGLAGTPSIVIWTYPIIFSLVPLAWLFRKWIMRTRKVCKPNIAT